MKKAPPIAYLLGALVVIGVIAFSVWSNSPDRVASSNLTREIELAKSLHIPLEVSDLRSNPPIPNASNAALVYQSAIPDLESKYEGRPGLSEALAHLEFNKATPAERKVVANALIAFAPLFDRIASASNMPSCEWPLADDKALSKLLIDSGTVAKLLEAKARLLNQEGRTADAYQALGTLVGLASQVNRGSGYIGAMMASLVFGMGMEAYHDAIQASAGNPKLLAEAAKALARFDRHIDLKADLELETVTQLGGIRALRTVAQVDLTLGRLHPKSIAERSTIAKAETGPLLPASSRQRYEAKFLASRIALVKSLPSDNADLRGAMNAIAGAISAAKRDPDPYGALNLHLLEHLYRLFPRAVGAVALVNCAATSVRVMQDRLRDGKYPSTLPAYGQIAIDPFTGGPIHYARAGSGFEVSVTSDYGNDGRPPYRTSWKFK